MDFDELDDQEEAAVAAHIQQQKDVDKLIAVTAKVQVEEEEKEEEDGDESLLREPTVESLARALVEERKRRRQAEQGLKAMASRLQQLQSRLESKAGVWALGSRKPDIHASAYVAPGASVVGSVTLRRDASIWFNCTLRGDNEVITIGEGSDIQDNSVLHCDEGKPLVVGRNCLVGHQVCLHGCKIGENCLIGMRTTVLDNAVIGNNSFVAAGSFIGEGRVFPDSSLIGGNPAKRIADLAADPEKMGMVMNAASGYVTNKDRFMRELRPFDEE